jgi:hypothetical protein
LVSPAPTGRLLITSSTADGHKTKCVCLWWFFSLVFEVPTYNLVFQNQNSIIIYWVKGVPNTTWSWIFWWSFLFFLVWFCRCLCCLMMLFPLFLWACCLKILSNFGVVGWPNFQVIVCVCFFLHGLTKCQSFVPWTINWSHCFDVIAVVEFICLFPKKSLRVCACMWVFLT